MYSKHNPIRVDVAALKNDGYFVSYNYYLFVGLINSYCI